MKGKYTVGCIVREWLIDNGYEGLYNTDLDCGCDLEDLMPCHPEICMDCQPGYRHDPNHPDYDYIISEKGECTGEGCEICKEFIKSINEEWD